MGPVALLLAVGATLQVCRGHEAFLGGCPSVPPMEDFDMEKFEGLWYIMEVFENGVKCMTWDIAKAGNETWQISEKRRSGVLYTFGLDSSSMTKGTLTQEEAPGAFTVKWAFNLAGSYDFVINYSDYDNVAGIFACQGLLIGHRQQALILSRTPILKPQYRQKVKGRLEGSKIETYYFKKVEQSRCGYEGEEETTQMNYGPLAVSQETPPAENADSFDY